MGQIVVAQEELAGDPELAKRILSWLPPHIESCIVAFDGRWGIDAGLAVVLSAFSCDDRRAYSKAAVAVVEALRSAAAFPPAPEGDPALGAPGAGSAPHPSPAAELPEEDAAGDLDPEELARRAIEGGHYTLVAGWVLASPLATSEKLVLSDIVDACGSGRNLSYAASSRRASERMGMNKSTYCHALASLESRGFIRRESRGRYSVAWMAVASFGSAYQKGSSLSASTEDDARVRVARSFKTKALRVPAIAVATCGCCTKAFMLAHVIAFGRQTGQALYAAASTIARWVGRGVSTIRQALRDLERMGVTHCIAKGQGERCYGGVWMPTKTKESRLVPSGLVDAARARRGRHAFLDRLLDALDAAGTHPPTTA